LKIKIGCGGLVRIIFLWGNKKGMERREKNLFLGGGFFFVSFSFLFFFTHASCVNLHTHDQEQMEKEIVEKKKNKINHKKNNY
jgi:phosphotransferase system  glucose/maltose/N-acetylglucosamine-specific IIC component